MTHAEFLRHTMLEESQVSYDDYTRFIEPTYMGVSEDKGVFCANARLLYYDNVTKVIAELNTLAEGELADRSNRLSAADVLPAYINASFAFLVHRMFFTSFNQLYMSNKQIPKFRHKK